MLTYDHAAVTSFSVATCAPRCGNGDGNLWLVAWKKYGPARGESGADVTDAEHLQGGTCSERGREEMRSADV